MDYLNIIKDIKAKKIKPLYFLTGEEPYFIDEIAKALDKYVLEPSERAFNYLEFYGKETAISSILDSAMRYPMMAERQVVMIKEAQYLKGLDDLTSYVKNPLDTTVMIFVYKNKALDGRTKFAKAIKGDKCVFYESKKLYDNQLPGWIMTYVKSIDLKIGDEEAHLLGDFLGTDLSKVVNELQKLKLNLAEGATITKDDIEKHIGLSKDYNVFELQDALVRRDAGKTFRIIEYFGNNPKANNIVMVISVLAGYFTKLYALRGANVTSADKARGVVGYLSPFILNKYIRESQAYSAGQLMAIIEILHAYDLQAKGVGVKHVTEHDLLRQMASDILSIRRPDFEMVYDEVV